MEASSSNRQEGEADNQSGNPDIPTGLEQTTNREGPVELEEVVEIHPNNILEEGEGERSGSDESLAWDTGVSIDRPLEAASSCRQGPPLTSTADSILAQYGIEVFSGSEESENDCEQHYPHEARSWSISVNRLERRDPLEISFERRPRPSRSYSIPDLDNLAGVVIGQPAPEREPQQAAAQQEEGNEVVLEALVEAAEVQVKEVVQEQAQGAPVVAQPQVQVVFGQEVIIIPEVPESPPVPAVTPDNLTPRASTMEEAQYNERCLDLDDKINDVEYLVEDLTVNDVFVHNLDQIFPKLDTIKTSFEAFRTDVKAFIREFDRRAHPEWAQEWENKISELMRKYKDNDRQVRAKVDELRAQDREALSSDSSRNTSINEDREKNLIEGKAKVKRKSLLKAMKDLQESLRKASRIGEMQDFEINKYLKESRKWIEEGKSIDKKFDELEELVVLYPLPSDQKEELDGLYVALSGDLKKVVNDLELEDASRKLYTLSQSSSKDAIPYPVYRSKPDEDVLKFIEEMKEAFIRNQIAVKDQPKILKLQLKNFAAELVHKDIDDIEEAYRILTKQFGNTAQIFASKYRIFEAECDKQWPAIDERPKEVYQKTTKLLSQLVELESLIASRSINKGQLYNPQNVEKLFSVIPTVIVDRALDFIDGDTDEEGKFKALRKGLEVHQNKAQQRMIMRIEKDKSSANQQYSQGPENQANSNKCFICGKDWSKDTHIRDWSVFGCPALLKLTTEKRKEELHKRKLCFNCGCKRISKNNKNPKFHKCKKVCEEIKCAEDSCTWNGLTCYHKKLDQDAKKKAKELLKVDIPGFNMVQLQVQPSLEVVEVQVNHETREPGSASLQGRIEDLQRGAVAKNMSDKQVQKWFSMREELSGGNVDKILGIPEGETLFVFCLIKGKTRALRAFMDGGCSSWLVRDGVPQNELKSVKLRDGPIPMWVAGGHTHNASAEWASLLPLDNGHHQIVRGLSTETVTGPFGDVNMVPIMEELKEAAKNSTSPGNKSVFKMRAPKELKGEVDMLIGSRYLNLFPEPIFSTPEGLTLFKSRFLPNAPGEVACVGGPSRAFSTLVNSAGLLNIISMFTRMTESPLELSPLVDSFPKADLHRSLEVMSEDHDMEDVIKVCEELLDDEDEEPAQCDVTCSHCGLVVFLLESEARKFLDLNDAGLRMEYRCPTCRNCLDCKRGETYEKISFKQEEEQKKIRESVWIDPATSRPMAKLPFRVDPLQHLNDNRGLAMKMLERVCLKYAKDEEVVDLIEKAFKKLKDNGHLVFTEGLSAAEKDALASAEIAHYIPWDVAFSGSVSTPARPTFNASKNTPKGSNLNDVLAKGIPNLVSLLNIILGWVAGPQAISGDISQFYNCVLLELGHLQFQRFLYKPRLNPSQPALEGVIRTLIYGVRSVSAQTEEVIALIAAKVSNDYPHVANFLLKSRYVDDLSKGVENHNVGKKIQQDTDKIFSQYHLKVKGWAMSGIKPPEEISKDGMSVSFAGMKWQPELDVFTLNHPALHFGVKVRGRFGKDVRFFNATENSMDDFVPEALTRRMISSKLMSRYNPMGKEAPLTLKVKFDLRNIVKNEPEWDAPVPPEVRAQWVKNFQMMENTREFHYCRAVIPVDAVNPRKMNVWVLSDAAERGGLIVGAWASYLRRDGTYSCSHLIGRGLLANMSSTPKLELHSLSTAANVKVMLEEALGEWLEVVRVGSDSEISLAWTMYESNKLDVFTRNRVNNIRAKVPLSQLHWVEGRENLADTGTRPEVVSDATVHPNSPWITGKAWMRESYENAIMKGIVRKVEDIRLGHEAKKKVKEGLEEEAEYERAVKGFFVRKDSQTAADRVVQCELESQYIYPPLKYPFGRTVRTVACVLLAVRKFKLCRLQAKALKGINVEEDLEKLKQDVKFRYFSTGEILKEQVKEFRVQGFFTSAEASGNNGRKFFCLSEEDLSASLEYLFAKSSDEVRRYIERSKVDEISVNKNGILFLKSRILDKQDLEAIGGVENILDVSGFAGLNFLVPVLYRYSPIAVSLASHLHWKFQHKGLETSYRLSLNFAYIIQGRAVFRQVAEDCVVCKGLRKKYLEVQMGNLDKAQVTITPLFHSTLVDCFGPLKAFCPGFEKVTRRGDKSYKVWCMVFCCVATGCVNVQVIESQDTDGVMSGFNRFFAEEAVPKVMFPDKGSSLIKALEEMEGVVQDLQLRLSEEKGVSFRPCLPQGHSAHGRVERVIRSLQESLEASGIMSERLTATAWQTVAKGIQNAYNNLPLGSYYSRSIDNSSLLQFLTPNLLKGKVSDRSPAGIYEVERDIGKLLDKTQALFRTWYSLWNTTYLPQLLLRPKWHVDVGQILEDDFVLFKLRESGIGVKWVLGKVEQVRKGRDGRVRECLILYKSIGETDRMILVERPVREVVKLFNLEDTTFHQEIENSRRIARSTFDQSESLVHQGRVLEDQSAKILNHQEDPYIEQILPDFDDSILPPASLGIHTLHQLPTKDEPDLDAAKEWLSQENCEFSVDDPVVFI